MRAADEEAFREFAQGRSPSLLRTAYLLSGDWERADDLVRTALAKVYRAWGRLQHHENVDAFARRAIVNAQSSWWGRLRGDRGRAPDLSGATDEREVLRRALVALPPRQRAVVVLRHYDGIDDAGVARLLGISLGAVRAHSTRGLAALRGALGDPYSDTARRHYDDDRVLAVLRDAVPPPPETAVRVGEVRRRAGHLRNRAVTQAIGAVASVLLVVGLAAAVSRTGGLGGIRPVDQPLAAFGDAIVKESSVRFEATMELVGDPSEAFGDADGGYGGSEMYAEMFSAHVTGAARADGDLRIDGDLSFLGFGIMGTTPGESINVRIVDDTLYRTIPEQMARQGKEWVSGSEPADDDVTALPALLRMLSAVAEDVKYVRQVEVRGTPAAEYRLTVPADVTDGAPLRVEFALDAQDRLRRVVAEVNLADLLGQSGAGDEPDYEGAPDGYGNGFPYPHAPHARAEVRIEVHLFDYGAPVDITAPPSYQVITERELYEIDDDPLDSCLRYATEDDEIEDCFETYRGGPDGGTSPQTTPSPPSCTTGPDGSTTCSSGSWVGPSGPEASPSPSP